MVARCLDVEEQLHLVRRNHFYPVENDFSAGLWTRGFGGFADAVPVLDKYTSVLLYLGIKLFPRKQRHSESVQKDDDRATALSAQSVFDGGAIDSDGVCFRHCVSGC